MKILFLVILIAFTSGCGTVRYRVIGEKDRKPHGEIQWDVIEFKFNHLWKVIAGGK